MESALEMGAEGPRSPSEITVDLMKKILEEEPSVRKLVHVEIDRDFGRWSLLSDTVRVKLNYSEIECEPKTLIVKFQKVSNPEREGQIYRLLAEAKVRSIPRLFGVFANGNLVLQDMSPAKPLSARNLTLRQARAVISILVDVNGKFVGDMRVPKNPVSQFANVIEHNMKESWPVFEERYRDQLGEVATDFEWMWKNAFIVSAHHNSEPTTLNHADVHIENLLFNDEGNAILIDWQLAGQKVLPFDISKLLALSLTVGQRRKHEDRLLKEYHDLLPNSIKTIYGFERLLLDYRACITRSMLSAVMAVGPRFEGRQDRLENASVMARRVIAAVKDFKPVDAIQELMQRNSLKLW